MRTPLPHVRRSLLLLVLAIAMGCTPLVGPYSPEAYRNAVSLKVETLALMEKAQEPYGAHRGEVEHLLLEARKAREFVKGIPSNGRSAQQWEILFDPDGHLAGRVFARWGESDTTRLRPVFLKEMEPLVERAFDAIICLEANKRSDASCLQKGTP